MAESTAPVPSTPAAPAQADPKAQVKAVTEAVKTGQPTPAQAEDAWEVQIDGKAVKKPRKEIVEAFQMRELSDRKRSEADKIRNEYMKVQAAAQKDPISFLKAMGHDFENLATQFLAKKAEDAMADPKDLELRKAKEEAELYKKYVEEQKAAKEKQEQDTKVATVRDQLHKEIITAIEEAKDLGLPVDEELVIQIAQKMMLQDKKQKPLNAKEALPKAYASSQKYLQSMASKMEGEALVKWLGPEVAKKIRKYDLAQLKAKRPAAPQPQALVQTKKEEAAPAKYRTWSQFKAEKLDTIK